MVSVPKYRDIVARTYIVVPDGLGEMLPAKPSDIYQLALDWVLNHVTKDDIVLLAPANAFHHNITEHAAAYAYLKQHNIKARVDMPTTVLLKYLTTRGNAIELKSYLQSQNRWPLKAPVHLVSYDLHLARARLSFSQEGYRVNQVHSVLRPAQFKCGLMVPRLWYYRYRFLHWGYEQFAMMLTKLKLI